MQFTTQPSAPAPTLSTELLTEHLLKSHRAQSDALDILHRVMIQAARLLEDPPIEKPYQTRATNERMRIAMRSAATVLNMRLPRLPAEPSPSPSRPPSSSPTPARPPRSPEPADAARSPFTNPQSGIPNPQSPRAPTTALQTRAAQSPPSFTPAAATNTSAPTAATSHEPPQPLAAATATKASPLLAAADEHPQLSATADKVTPLLAAAGAGVSRFGERLVHAQDEQPAQAQRATHSNHSPSPVSSPPTDSEADDVETPPPPFYLPMSNDEYTRLERQIGFIEANRRRLIRLHQALEYAQSKADSS